MHDKMVKATLCRGSPQSSADEDTPITLSDMQEFQRHENMRKHEALAARGERHQSPNRELSRGDASPRRAQSPSTLDSDRHVHRGHQPRYY